MAYCFSPVCFEDIYVYIFKFLIKSYKVIRFISFANFRNPWIFSGCGTFQTMVHLHFAGWFWSTNFTFLSIQTRFCVTEQKLSKYTFIDFSLCFRFHQSQYLYYRRSLFWISEPSRCFFIYVCVSWSYRVLYLVILAPYSCT